jgi:hypothetical protein
MTSRFRESGVLTSIQNVFGMEKVRTSAKVRRTGHDVVLCTGRVWTSLNINI